MGGKKFRNLEKQSCNIGMDGCSMTVFGAFIVEACERALKMMPVRVQTTARDTVRLSGNVAAGRGGSGELFLHAPSLCGFALVSPSVFTLVH